MSLFWGFCPNLLNSAQIPRLLHCCHVVSDELSVNVWWVGYTLMHWQSLRERPGLCSQCQVFHCGTVTVTGNYLATCHFPSDLLTFIVGGDRKVGAPIRKKLEDDRKTGSHQLPLWHLLLPRVQTRCSLHIVTLNILKFCQGHPPSTSTLTAIHLRHRGDTGVTSINNYPDTLGDNCWWVCTAQLPGLRVELGGL